MLISLLALGFAKPLNGCDTTTTATKKRRDPNVRANSILIHLHSRWLMSSAAVLLYHLKCLIRTDVDEHRIDVKENWKTKAIPSLYTDMGTQNTHTQWSEKSTHHSHTHTVFNIFIQHICPFTIVNVWVSCAHTFHINVDGIDRSIGQNFYCAERER